MKFGVLDHLDFGADLNAHYKARLAMVRQLDNAGFYGLHVTEHHGTPLGGAAAPSVFLAAAAQHSTRLRLGTLVYALPTHNPLRLIEEICMLDQISDGRLDIGFGRGSVPFELGYYGLDPDEARDIYDEALTVICQGLTEHALNHQGRYYTFRDVPIALRPYQTPMPPTWYGVHSVESAERAARLGHHIVCNQAVAASATYIAAYRARLRQLGTDPAPRMIGLHRAVFVGRSDSTALAVADRAYKVFLERFRFVSARHGVMPKISGVENSFAELMDAGRAVAGSPATVAAFLSRELAGAGANYCLMYLAFGDLTPDEIRQSIDLFAAEAMPAIRGAVPAS